MILAPKTMILGAGSPGRCDAHDGPEAGGARARAESPSPDPCGFASGGLASGLMVINGARSSKIIIIIIIIIITII